MTMTSAIFTRGGLWLVAVLMVAPLPVLACEGPVAVCDGKGEGFALIRDGKPATVYVDAGAVAAVSRVADDFASDLEKVSGIAPAMVHDLSGVSGDVVVIAQAGSPLITDWVKQGLISTDVIIGQWEAYEQVVTGRPGGGKALVIIGADRRGAVYGTYDISARMGVSPWTWWADVPVAQKTDVTVMAGMRHDQPVVKYRGFFLNDEEPALGGWAREKFGGLNHQFYAKVFELDLRLKGNMLWPAMWGKSIADDDPESLKTADDYGIVLGTSHHEPMTRAQEEWHRHQDQGVTGGAWDYTKNADNLRTFWRGGMERAKPYETLVTVGMRGDGDEPMTEGTATQLLQTIVADQRKIIAEITGKPASETPQVWALYKEVQDYYDHGMSAPDDVTLLFADDNWGQIRRLPDPKAQPRAGGYGVYYHFDYVGGPRNYKWVNSTQIEKTWQQMELAHESGADRLWIVNVGDLKPVEYPLSFFLDMAWNPDAMTPDAVKAYPEWWAAQQFGPEHATEIGEVLTRYSQYNARRKAELLDAGVFGKDPQWSARTGDYQALNLRAEDIGRSLPQETAAAWFELVQYSVAASANLYELYDRVARNHALAASNPAAAGDEATAANWAFGRDSTLAAAYNETMDGKWDHMMDQTHIGYTGWQQPDENIMPDVTGTSDPEAETPIADPAPTPAPAPFDPAKRFSDQGGFVAIEAEHFVRKVERKPVRWAVIPNLGRTLSSVLSLPQTAAPSDAGMSNATRLEYDVTLGHDADATLNLYVAPTLDVRGRGGLRVAVAIDDGAPQVLSFDLKPDTPAWNAAVSDNIVVLSAVFPGLKAGSHTIKVFRVDGNAVLERLVLDTGGLKPSYLGPPESPMLP